MNEEGNAMIVINDKADCCGCGACAAVCPRGCIALLPDSEGFLYPHIDRKACVGCGLCERSCPLLHRPSAHGLLGVYGAKNTDDGVRRQSSSGGVFTLLAERTLARQGVVFGAALDEALQVRHFGVDDAKGLARLRGSKYVQSVIGSCYREARELLRRGRQVLFSGTPCQIAGLKGFLGREDENLLTVDVVCHGVPSPKVYRKHLAELAEVAGEPVLEVLFRDKADGWKRGKTLFLTAHQAFGDTKRRETYMRLFLNNVSIRPSCGNCAFNNKRSLADITIADYWGVEKHFADFDDDKGVTLVLINTLKGAEAFDCLREKMLLQPTDFAKGAEYNQAVARSLPLHPRRGEFFAALERRSLRAWAALLLDK